jgi:hypothetical protein
MKGAVQTGDPPGADSFATRFGLIRYAPQAIKLDKAWTEGVPDRWPVVGEYLRRRTGHSFPVQFSETHIGDPAYPRSYTEWHSYVQDRGASWCSVT